MGTLDYFRFCNFQILEALPEFPVHSATRHVRSAEASIFVNLCLALGQTGHPIPLATAENVSLSTSCISNFDDVEFVLHVLMRKLQSYY